MSGLLRSFESLLLERFQDEVQKVEEYITVLRRGEAVPCVTPTLSGASQPMR